MVSMIVKIQRQFLWSPLSEEPFPSALRILEKPRWRCAMALSGSRERSRVILIKTWILVAVGTLFSVFIASAEDSPAQLIEQGHFKRAEALLRPQLQKNPGDPQAHYLMSRVDLAFRRV